MVDWLSEARIFTTLIIIIEEEHKNMERRYPQSITAIDSLRAVVYKHNTHKTWEFVITGCSQKCILKYNNNYLIQYTLQLGDCF